MKKYLYFLSLMMIFLSSTISASETIDNCTCSGHYELRGEPYTYDWRLDYIHSRHEYSPDLTPRELKVSPVCSPDGTYVIFYTEDRNFEHLYTVKLYPNLPNDDRVLYIGHWENWSKATYYHCYPCNESSDPTPTSPQDTNTTKWKQIAFKSCKDTAPLPEVCNESNASILLQTWKTGCCGTNTKCWKAEPVCTEPNTDFSPLADNQQIAFTWNSSNDRSSECAAILNSEEQTRKVNCEDEYRCVVESPGIECDEPISSYVSPKDRSFHEDIEITSVYFGLHYSSANVEDTTIAHGWSLTSHARLEGNKLYLGNGTLHAFKVATLEGNNTVVPYGTDELLFDADGTHLSTRDLYTKDTELSFGYDNVGLLASVTDRYGQVTTLNRDDNDTLTSITAPYGQTTYLSIDSQGDLVEVQYEDTSSYTFEYENHLMTVEREPNGNAFLHFFDENGSVVKVIDAEQGVWRFDSKNQETYGLNTVIRADGDVIRYTNHFLKNGMLVSQKILPTGDKVRYSNAIDETKSITTSCGMRTVNVYRTNSDGTLYLDPYTHKRVLKSTVSTTPGGLRQAKSYLDKHVYSDEGNLTRLDHISRLNGKRSIYRKDFVNHKEVRFSPENRRDYLYYDEKMQNIIGNKPHGLAKTHYIYDALGRVIEEKVGKRTTTYTYDDRGNLHTVTNPLGQTTTYSYDTRDRVSEVIYPDGTQERFTYDSNGNLVTRRVPTPTDHLFTYNGVNKRSGYTSPEQKVTTYSYDKQRRLTKTTKPSGKTIENIYTNSRLTTLKTPEGDTTYDYSCQSNLSSVAKGSERIDYAYDGTLLTTITQSGVLNQNITYSYNNDFLPSSVTYAGTTQSYIYDADNYLTSAGDFTVTRTNNDKNITITDGYYTKNTKINGYGEAYKVEDNKLIVQLLRNNGGQITRKVETLEGQKTVYKYSYDARGKLTEVKRNNKVVETYAYDANGNRQQARVHDTNITASYTLDDQLIVYGDNTYRYDDDGYLTEKTTPEGTTTYTYGTLGELREVQTPTKTITYKHNANNQRVAKYINGQIVEKYLWQNLTTLLAVYDKDDNLVQRFKYAGDRMPLSMTDANGTKYYLHYDRVGSLRAVSRVLSPDNTLEVLKEIVYDTYGNILTDTNSSLSVPFGFAGGLYDPDTKLTRFGYRDYDAYTGKWTAKDPIGFDGGDSNLYGYVLGDPVSFIDPTGEIAIVDDITIVCIAALGAWAIHEATPHIKNLVNQASHLPDWLNRQLDDLTESPRDKQRKECQKRRNTCTERCSKYLTGSGNTALFDDCMNDCKEEQECSK